ERLGCQVPERTEVAAVGADRDLAARGALRHLGQRFLGGGTCGIGALGGHADVGADMSVVRLEPLPSPAHGHPARSSRSRKSCHAITATVPSLTRRDLPTSRNLCQTRTTGLTVLACAFGRAVWTLIACRSRTSMS